MWVVESTDTLFRALVVAKPEEDRLPQMSVACVFAIRDLADKLRLDWIGVLNHRFVRAKRCELLHQLATERSGEPRACAPDAHELAISVLANRDRANVFRVGFDRIPADDHEVAGRTLSHLHPIVGSTRQVAAVRTFADDPFEA